MKIIIRAGGVGERLWPYSRKNSPKQFQGFVTNNSLLKDTFQRVSLIVPPKNIFVSVQREFLSRVLKELPKLVKSNIIKEPVCKNTGPAIAYEVAWLKERGVKQNEIIASLPADDYVRFPKRFKSLTEGIEQYLTRVSDQVVIPGVLSENLDTGFSYIKRGKQLGGP